MPISERFPVLFPTFWRLCGKRIGSHCDHARIHNHKTVLWNIFFNVCSAGDKTSRPDLHTRVHADLDPDPRAFADNSSELHPPRRNLLSIYDRHHLTFIEPEVPRRTASTKGDVGPHNTVADVRHVCPDAVPQNTSLDFRSVADHAVLPNRRSAHE